MSKAKGSPLRAKGAGTISPKNGHWHVRVSLPDGTRPWYTLCKAKLTGECTCMAMSEARRAEVAAPKKTLLTSPSSTCQVSTPCAENSQ